jgi:hypothetical protein
VHGPGSCRRSVSSGSATCASVDPGCRLCPPGLRPLLRRNDFRAGLTNGRVRRRRPRRVLAVLLQPPRQLRDLSLQRLDHRPKLRVLSGKLLIRRTRIDRHHTIINNSLPSSTNHAEDLTSYVLNTQWPAVQTVERFSAAITVAEQTAFPYLLWLGICSGSMSRRIVSRYSSLVQPSWSPASSAPTPALMRMRRPTMLEPSRRGIRGPRWHEPGDGLRCRLDRAVTAYSSASRSPFSRESKLDCGVGLGFGDDLPCTESGGGSRRLG